jgi:hypothetical protein
MSFRIRAKFRCVSETKNCYGFPDSRVYKFQAMYDPEIPEDLRYAQATPSGSLEMTVDNPSAQFTVGAYYYLDFEPADVDLAAPKAPLF